MSEYTIRPGNLAVGREEDEIRALALGAGVVVCLYDEEARTGGMVYALFPDSGEPYSEELQELKYVDTALDILEKKTVQAGARTEKLWGKIVGGAQIFRFFNTDGRENIGRRNVEAAKEWMREHGIPIKAEDTGNDFGRTVRFSLPDGNIEVELVNKYKYYI